MLPIRPALLCGILASLAAPAPLLSGQQIAPASPSSHATLGDTWDHLKALPPHAHMHVAADHGGSTCFFISADDATLTCGRRDGGPSAQHVFPRAEVKSVKLTRYGASTAGGAAIGLGAGAVIGVAVYRPKGGFDVGLGAARASAALVGAIGGAVVGRTTDMFRGPVVYRRIDSQ